MKSTGPVEIDSFRLASFGTDSLEEMSRSFADAVPITMRQAWREELEPGFLPARVRTGWRDDTLLILAELEDADIFNAATEPNQRTWLLGDVLEVFLQASDQPSYVEFHVTPENNRLQMAFPGLGLEPRLVEAPAFHSQTWVNRERQLWTVYMKIPSVSVSGQREALLGNSWRFSFSRYDYTRGYDLPILSSTSAHREPAFHCPDEWGLLRFKERAGRGAS